MQMISWREHGILQLFPSPFCLLVRLCWHWWNKYQLAVPLPSRDYSLHSQDAGYHYHYQVLRHAQTAQLVWKVLKQCGLFGGIAGCQSHGLDTYHGLPRALLTSSHTSLFCLRIFQQRVCMQTFGGGGSGYTWSWHYHRTRVELFSSSSMTPLTTCMQAVSHCFCLNLPDLHNARYSYGVSNRNR